MIPPPVVKEVRRLLAEGRLSQRAVAKVAGVSRGSVALIAQGRRPDYATRQRDDDRPSGPLRRCPGCGGMVDMPCRVCGLRVLLARARPAPTAGWDEEPGEITLELDEDSQARYEEVRYGVCRAPAPGAEEERAC